MKIMLVDDLHTIFLYLFWEIEAILQIAKFSKIFKTDENSRSGELFRHKCHRKLGMLSR